jgi:hypothetical protein
MKTQVYGHGTLKPTGNTHVKMDNINPPSVLTIQKLSKENLILLGDIITHLKILLKSASMENKFKLMEISEISN